MSQIAEGISQVASIGATVFKFIPGGQAISAALTVVAAAASVVAQLTATPPVSVPAAGDQQIGTNLPMPYLMGRAKSEGQLVYKEAHGNEVDGVPNPFLTQVWVHSACGPIQSMGSFRANEEVITFAGNEFTTNGEAQNAVGYYNDFMHMDDQVGDTPVTQAMELPSYLDGQTRWGAAYKLSGMAATMVSIRADDKETHYSSGIPLFSRVPQGVKVYDPRLDDTVAGGSGAHRAKQETTYAYSENIALHALTYALGRYQNSVHVFGAGLPVDAIRIDDFIAFANVCDANSWTIGGTIYESGEEGEIWNNLKLILDAGGAKPTIIGGKLGVAYQAPRVAVFTVEESDLIGPYSVPGFRPWSKGRNTVIPRYMSEANNWEYVASQAYQDAALLAAQGEERIYERKFDLVTDKDQATELSVYDLWAEIEKSPITLTVGPKFIGYDVHDAGTLNLSSLGLDGVTAVILQHTIDYETGFVTLVLRTDTAQKHTDALGQTGTAPPHPPVVPNEDLDGAVGRLNTVTAVSGIIDGTQAVGDPRIAGIIDGTQPLDDVTLTGRGSLIGENVTRDANIQDAKNQSSGALSASLTPPFASASGIAGASETTNAISYDITGGTAPYSWTLTRTVNNNSSTASVTSGTTATGSFDFTVVIPVEFTQADKYEFEVTDDNSDTYTVEISAYFSNNN